MTDPRSLKPGDRITTDRPHEGVVTVICPWGACTHGHSDRYDSVHVRGAHYSELFGAYTSDWFVCLPDNPRGIEEWGAKVVK